jgi:hypothetical protein
MIHLTKEKLFIEVETDDSAGYLLQLQSSLTDIIISVAETELISEKAESIYVLKEFLSELALNKKQLRKIIDMEEQ